MFRAKLIPPLLASTLLVAASTGCGSTASSSSSHSGAGAQREAKEAASLAAALARYGVASYRNDRDIDPGGDPDEDNGRDIDNDPWYDYKVKDENRTYLDLDDGPTINSGGAETDPAARKAVQARVERYFAAASADDGAKACAMFVPGSAKNVPRYANSSLAPAYMRGGKTCAATMDRLFKHFHGWLSHRVVVTDVRLRNGQAFALLGSKTMPARYIEAVLHRGIWWLEIPLAGDPLLANSLN